MWDLIINPFITVLTFLYGVLGNDIVLSIALFTVVIRLATSPLLIQQQRSAKAMQEMQPKLTELREKYKNDREKLAQAQMELYREGGVNPLGGCLPLLVQLPILLGLYQAINFALAGSPFQLIDLSGRLLLPGLDAYVPLQNEWLGMDLTLAPTVNPVYALALPGLVLVTTWLQSKLTMPVPQDTGDGVPNQAAQMTRSMTTFMPIMFGFFSLSFPVGLSIYFVVSNVVGIVQYTLMGRAEWGRLLGREPEKDEGEKAKPGEKAKNQEAEAPPTSVKNKPAASKAISGQKANATKNGAGNNTANNGTARRPATAKGGKPRKMKRASEKAK